jgi:hypothetical protein
MLVNKKIMIVTCLLAVVTFSAMTSMNTDDHPAFKNLKVLPKNIPHEALHQVMDDWAQALGVHCNFCHARGADNKMDFASDAKPEKNMAREMYKMAAKINNKYFEGKKDSLGMVTGSIKCMTCHRGDPHPDDIKGMDMHDHGGMHGPGGDMHDHDMHAPSGKRDSVPPPPGGGKP